MTKRVAIAGSSGLIGDALRRLLLERGDEVIRLVRGRPTGSDEWPWAPDTGDLPLEALEGVDAVVNLAGAGIGDRRWDADRKRLIERSRVDSTRTIAQALVRLSERAGRRVRFVNGSAVGYYGDRREEVLTEESRPGTDFLAGVVQRWEAAAMEAGDAGVPVTVVRTGLVMAPSGGAFAPLLLLTRFGLGGPLGTGSQWWPWITLADEVRAIAYLIDTPEVTGPVNVVAPEQHRQREIAAELGRQLSRPALLPAPRLALRLAVGEFGDRILDSQRVVPALLTQHGFTFTHPDLRSAVRWLSAR